MAINIGSQSIVKNGLVAALDASNSENYAPLTFVEVLVVAAGGGGGFGETNVNGGGAGGGGAGGLLYSNNYSVTAGSAINVTTGNGGSSAANESTISNNGQNSVFGNLTAIGGGGGGGGGVEGNNTANSGGSGGGAGGDGNTVAFGGAGTAGQGFAGGGRISNRNRAGSGGGGAGALGSPGFQSGTIGAGGKGGNGLLFNISGRPRYYAGGGGGACSQNFAANTTISGGAGGTGGGGFGAPFGGASNTAAGGAGGVANSGGGGGGGYGTSGGTGGSGVVIVRYPGPQKAIGGTITQVDGYTIHTFNTSSSFTPLTTAQLQSTFYGLNDLSGNNNIATPVNGPTYTSENGGGIVFDGTDDYLILNHNYPHPRTIDFNNSTVIYVAKLSSSPNNRNTIFAQYTGTGAQHEWFNTGYLRSNYRDATAGTPELDAPNGVGQINTNTVYHITVTYGQKTIAHYKNGVSLGSATNSTHNNVNGATRVNIGRNNAAGLYFKGTIYHVLIYDRVLSQDEVTRNFNAVKGRFGL